MVHLQKQLGVTTVFVTHDQVDAMTMGDLVVVMKVVGPPQFVLEQRDHLGVVDADAISSESMLTRTPATMAWAIQCALVFSRRRDCPVPAKARFEGWRTMVRWM
ncbi:hypothetical protein GOA99_18585 [Sinorhizobium meliloti]|nr:hypothetical protein [Sinorhizobium meliloti]